MYVLRVCVCGMRVLCFGVVVCCAMWLCVVLVQMLVCNVGCVVSEVCGVWVACVVSVVCVVCVWRGLARGKTSVWRFKTLPCVPAKRAHALNLHTGTF